MAITNPLNTLSVLAKDVEVLAQELKAAGALKGSLAALKAEKDAAYAAHIADIDPVTGDAPYRSKLLWQRAKSDFKEAMKKLTEAHELSKPEGILKGTPVAGNVEAGLRAAWRRSTFPGILKLADPHVWWAGGKGLTIGAIATLSLALYLGYEGLLKTGFDVAGISIGGSKIHIPFTKTNIAIPKVKLMESFAEKQAGIKQSAEEEAIQAYKEHKINLGTHPETVKASAAYYPVDKARYTHLVNENLTADDLLEYLNTNQSETYTKAPLEALPSQTQITPFFFHNETRDVATVDAPGRGKCVIASLDGAIILIPLESYKSADLPMHEGEAPKADLGKPPSGPEQGPPTPPPRVDPAANGNGGPAPGGTEGAQSSTESNGTLAARQGLNPEGSNAQTQASMAGGGSALFTTALAIGGSALFTKALKSLPNRTAVQTAVSKVTTGTMATRVETAAHDASNFVRISAKEVEAIAPELSRFAKFKGFFGHTFRGLAVVGVVSSAREGKIAEAGVSLVENAPFLASTFKVIPSPSSMATQAAGKVGWVVTLGVEAFRDWNYDFKLTGLPHLNIEPGLGVKAIESSWAQRHLFGPDAIVGKLIDRTFGEAAYQITLWRLGAPVQAARHGVPVTREELQQVQRIRASRHQFAPGFTGGPR